MMSFIVLVPWLASLGLKDWQDPADLRNKQSNDETMFQGLEVPADLRNKQSNDETMFQGLEVPADLRNKQSNDETMFQSILQLLDLTPIFKLWVSWQQKLTFTNGEILQLFFQCILRCKQLS
jgi:hypothetical protein